MLRRVKDLLLGYLRKNKEQRALKEPDFNRIMVMNKKIKAVLEEYDGKFLVLILLVIYQYHSKMDSMTSTVAGIFP